MRARLYVAAVAGALALFAILIVVVLRVGQRDPSPPSLRDHPRSEIPGTIAFADTDGCIIIASASGQSRRKLSCPGNLSSVAWVDANTIRYSKSSPSAFSSWTVDVTTGQEQPQSGGSSFIRTTETSPRGGEAVSVESDGSVYRTDGGKTRIFNFDGPMPPPEFLTWSPDGEWVLVAYRAKNELWIIRRDGSLAGTLSGNASADPSVVSWWIDGKGALPAR